MKTWCLKTIDVNVDFEKNKLQDNIAKYNFANDLMKRFASSNLLTDLHFKKCTKRISNKINKEFLNGVTYNGFEVKCVVDVALFSPYITFYTATPNDKKMERLWRIKCSDNDNTIFNAFIVRKYIDELIDSYSHASAICKTSLDRFDEFVEDLKRYNTFVSEIVNKDYPISFEQTLYDGMVNYNIH